MKKKLTSLLLLIIPLFAYSETVYVDGLKYDTNPTEKTASLTGYQGDNPTGELTISSTITVNSVEYAVTSIGDYAFDRCIDLTGELVIPNSISNIGECAFYYCTGFTGELTIPNSVTSIGDAAFGSCSGFTGDLTIPNSVASIGDGAFSRCSGFTGNLAIGSSVKSIGERVIRGCSGLTEISVDDNNNYYKSVDGVLFNKELTELIRFPEGKSYTNYNISNSVTSIGYDAFCGCINLTGNITIPNSVTSIGVSAFGMCSGLTGELIIPNSVTSIGHSAFSRCSGFTGDLNIPNSVITISEWAFGYCTGFTGELNIPNSVTSIGDYAFYDCNGLKEVNVNWETPLEISTYVWGPYNFEDASLSVPLRSMVAYIEDDVWGKFGSIGGKSTLAVADNLADTVKVIAVDGTLMVSGAADGAAVKVYNLNGVIVANGVVTDGTSQIKLPTTKGIYIVTIGTKNYKIVG